MSNGYKTISRRASHAGSWYKSSPSDLNAQLTAWMAKVQRPHAPARAVIVPHAGFDYSGSTAAYAFKQIDVANVDRIFILGPSHHICLNGCAVTGTQKYKTPLYDLVIDQKVTADLLASGSFEVMDLETDEAEHSIEMQLPYIAKIFESRRDQISIIPILVGSLSANKHAHYGRILAPYLEDPRTVFVVSSDFCHWGPRFNYAPLERNGKSIHEQIECMDRKGMDHIESLSPAGFNDYLRQTQNTICGRHPISVLLCAIETLGTTGRMKFLHYAQSNRAKTPADSSVSYAAGSYVHG